MTHGTYHMHNNLSITMFQLKNQMVAQYTFKLSAHYGYFSEPEVEMTTLPIALFTSPQTALTRDFNWLHYFAVICHFSLAFGLMAICP